ncbi:hypothetical protein ACTWQF_05850 [Streptomyces sp. 8N114]|uniref:hypothetical protein n=1 Tax=Streptomyces sp. 8N114 TaxID=3457419 RepID=UPI003FD08D1C
MACESGTGNPLLDIAKGFFDFLGDPIGTIVKGIANAIMAGAIAAFGAVTKAVPTFEPAKSGPVNDQVQWLVVYVAVGSLLFACIRMAAERRGEPGQTALKGMVRLIVVAGGGTAIVGAAATVGDNYANYLFAGAVNEQVQDMGCGPSSGIEPFLLLVLAFLLLIAAIVHTILLYVRLGVMIILFGTLPLAAAASMSDWGGGWWRKHIGWMIAWLLYKPAAGLVIYAGSDLLTGGEGGEASDKIHTKIAGICVMLLSAIALPALLKLVVPATAALGGDSAYSTAVSGAAGGIASGAKSIGGGAPSAAARGAAGSGGSSGGSGPSGASGSSGGGGQSGQGGRTGPSGTVTGAMGNSDGSGGGGSGPSGGGQSAGGGGGGQSAGGGRGAGGGGTGGGSAGGPSGAARGAGAAAGPAGMAVEAAVAAAKTAGKLVAGGVDGADGAKGHNE